MPTIEDGVTEAANAQDTIEATVTYAVDMTETAAADDSFTAGAIFNAVITEEAHATEKMGGTAFYWHPFDNSRHVQLASVHDVLTDRHDVSDATDRHDLLRAQLAPRRPYTRKV